MAILWEDFQTLNFKNIFLFINILSMEKKDEINTTDMKTYSKKIRINYKTIWDAITSNQIEYLNEIQFYSNSTYIVYIGKPIIKYRKCSFFYEGEHEN